MQLFAALRGLGILLVGGTLVGFLPQIESPAESADAEAAAKPPVQVAQVEAKPASKSKDHVKAKVFLSVDKLPAGEKCKFAVVLDVEDGWHVHANPASLDNLIATSVTTVSKLKSKQLDTLYPEGSEIEIEDFSAPVAVYEGEVVIRGEIQAPKDAAGKTDQLEFQIKYQACNEKNCLPPKTLKLPGQLPIVKPGTPVKQVNQKYFAAAKK